MTDRQGSYNTAPGSLNAAAQSRRQARKSIRVRSACLRCQKRKIKCDGNIPNCSGCRRAGVECIEKIKPTERYSDIYVQTLLDRIKWLETNLQTHCPDFDLDDGPQIMLRGSFPPRDNTSQSTVQSRPHQNEPLDTSSVQLEIIDDSSSARPAHEINLVPVTAGQDLRYIGPSSGYTFANLLIASIGKNQKPRRPPLTAVSMPLILSEAFKVPPMDKPATMEHAMQLSQAYWDNINWQYPFLHQPTHNKLIENVYANQYVNPAESFQVLMVLAISTTILSRRMRTSLSSEGYCAKAMTYFEKITIEGSIRGLQCLLLLQMYGMHNPSLGLNSWYLNYQCIACVLDLGLQRDVKIGKNITLLDQEMRTRIFWVVHTLDRTLATILGRPIGLRDEACDLRLPADLDDEHIMSAAPTHRSADEPATYVTCAIHTFKLSLLNSEIKYIANSITHDTPAFTYPQIPDAAAWQSDVLNRLEQWSDTIPRLNDAQRTMSRIRYHEVVMLLLRPSPAIPTPSSQGLQTCYESAITVLRLYDELYRGENLVLSWQTLYSIFLTTVTVLYCIWTVPSIRVNITVSDVLTNVKSASMILSALAEHFSEARRARDLLDDLSSATITWVMDNVGVDIVQPSPNTSLMTNLNTAVTNFRDRDGVHQNTQLLQDDLGNLEGVYVQDQFTLQQNIWDPFFGLSEDMTFPPDFESLLQGVLGDL